MYKKRVLERTLCVLQFLSTFLSFMFVDDLSLVDVFSQLYYLTYGKQQQGWLPL